MSFSCPICSDSLVRVPADPTNSEGAKISCAPCGHLFHAFCIQKWLGGTLATSSQCPCCRVAIPRKKCLPLYPTIHDDSVLDDSVNDGVGVCNHGPLIDDLRLKTRQLTENLAQSEDLNKTLRHDLHRIESKLKSQDMKFEQLLIRCKAAESMQTYSEELEAKLKNAQVELNSLRAVQSVIDSIRNDVEYKQQECTFEDLKTINSVLTRELKSAGNSHKESLRMQENLRTENRRAKNEIKKLKDEKEDLENHVAILKMELEELKRANGEESFGKTPSPSITPNRKRKSESDNKLFNLDESVIEISPELDDDIMVFKPFHGGRSRELKLGRKLKSSNDLNTAFACSSSSSKKHGGHGSSLKISHSAADVLSGDSSSLAASSSAIKKPSKKITKDDDAFDVRDLSKLGFSSNLKSSLPGLSVTPTTSYRRVAPTSGFGIPRKPKVIKK